MGGDGVIAFSKQIEVSGQLHAPATLPKRTSPSTHWIGGWVSHNAGLEVLRTILRI